MLISPTISPTRNAEKITAKLLEIADQVSRRRHELLLHQSCHWLDGSWD